MDYSYCSTEDCIHRRGCKRYVGNYEEKIESTFWIKPLDCINSKPWRFEHLDRFRNSDGTPLEDDKLKGFTNV